MAAQVEVTAMDCCRWRDLWNGCGNAAPNGSGAWLVLNSNPHEQVLMHRQRADHSRLF